MKNSIIKSTVFAMVVVLLIGTTLFPIHAEDNDTLKIDAASAILMEASTGQVFFEMNADQPLPPASVTKIMTLLIVMEAIDAGTISLDDQVQTSDYAASMGGSQVYLKAGETMSVEDMIKSVVIASANDAAVALAEFIAGSEEAFVNKMNERAKELGMNNTNFENTNGLDDTAVNHIISARDIAIMSRELIRHEKILEYSSIWMDTIRNGEFGLTNTNRLIRFYSGANGLKTGSTSKAKFCISATAKRDGMQLIAVIMGSPTRDTRNECAKKLLDYGFANYGRYSNPAGTIENIKVYGGTNDSVTVEYGEFNAVVPKSELKNIQFEISLPKYLSAPVKAGEQVGDIVFKNGDTEVGKVPIYTSSGTDRISLFGVVYKIIRQALLAGK